MRTGTLVVAVLGAICPVAAGSQEPARAEVLVIGTYHMNNPGRDIFNLQADDVLEPQRQREIAELLEVLKRFHPTKVAIESDPSGPRPRQYADYLAGTYTLTRNEIDQLGFRLAGALGRTTIYPVDADADFPYQHLVDWAKANGAPGTSTPRWVSSPPASPRWGSTWARTPFSRPCSC